MTRLEMIEQIGRNYYELYKASAISCGKTPISYQDWLNTESDKRPGYLEDISNNKIPEKEGTATSTEEAHEENCDFLDCKKCGKCSMDNMPKNPENPEKPEKTENTEKTDKPDGNDFVGYKYRFDGKGNIIREKISRKEFDDKMKSMSERDKSISNLMDDLFHDFFNEKKRGYEGIFDELEKGLFFI